MRYLDGQTIQLGDIVDTGHGNIGTIVAIMDDGEYALGYNPSDLAVFSAGFVVNTRRSGDVHYDEPDEDLILVRRA